MTYVLKGSLCYKLKEGRDKSKENSWRATWIVQAERMGARKRLLVILRGKKWLDFEYTGTSNAKIFLINIFPLEPLLVF